jgi:rhodanese-related sulfurtransferase
MSKRSLAVLISLIFILTLVPAAYSADADLAKKMGDVLAKGPAEGHWQVKAADVAKMIAEKKTDFLVVDVRPNPPGQQGGKIPGSIYIPYNEILKPDNLKKLPKDKKIIMVCVTGQTQNLPVVPLRVLGYDARTMSFGMSAWIPGYFGGKLMTDAVGGAAAAKYPVEK